MAIFMGVRDSQNAKEIEMDEKMMEGNKRYNSVIEMVEDISDDPEFVEGLRKTIESRQLVKDLVVNRIRQNLSEKDLADKMKVDISKVYEIEDSVDDEIPLGDFRKYVDALGLEFKATVYNRTQEYFDCLKKRTIELESVPLNRLKRLFKGEQLRLEINVGNLEKIIKICSQWLEHGKVDPFLRNDLKKQLQESEELLGKYLRK